MSLVRSRCLLVAWLNGSKAYSALQSQTPHVIPPSNTLHIMQRSMRSLTVRNIVDEYDVIRYTSKVIANAMIITATIRQRVLFILIMF